MTIAKPVAVAIGLTLAAFPAHSQAPAAPLAPGFTTRSYAAAPPSAASPFALHRWSLGRAGQPDARIDLVLIVLAAPDARMTVLPVARHGASAGLFRSAGCRKGAVAVNGSFYIRDARGARPIGLVRVSGRTLSAPSGRRFGGFLAASDGPPKVLARSQAGLAVAAQQAIESSPLVIEKGASGIRRDDGVRFDRAGIGSTPAGQTVVAGAFGVDQDSVTLAEFARLVIAAGGRVRAPVTDMLAMDGGPSAHVYLTGTDQLFGSKGAAYLPNVICLGGRP